MAFSDNQEQHRKALRGLQLKMIIGSLPAAASKTLIAAAVLIQIVARHRFAADRK